MFGPRSATKTASTAHITNALVKMRSRRRAYKVFSGSGFASPDLAGLPGKGVRAACSGVVTVRGFERFARDRGVVREAGGSWPRHHPEAAWSVANVPRTLPSTVALYPPPSGSVSMPPPGEWGEVSRGVFGVATASASFCDAPRRGRAPVPLLFGGMVAECARSQREPQHRTLASLPPTTFSGTNLVAVYFRAPCRARRRDGDPHRAQVRGTPAHPVSPRPHRSSSAACAVEPGRRRRSRNRTRV